MGKFADELKPKFADDTTPKLSDFATGSVAWLIQRVIEDVAADPTMPQFGESKLATLRVIQRMEIGKKKWEQIKKPDIIEFARVLRRKPLKPATINQYIGYLRVVVVHAYSSFPDCEHLDDKPITKAKHFMRKKNLIAKAERRTRLPTAEEIGMLLDDLAKSDAQRGTKIKMVPVVAFGLVSARRRGEICRITHGDIDYEKKIYWVRDLKHPTKKKGNDKSFTLWPELEQLIMMQPRLTNRPDERIFPYKPESVTKRYIDAKKRCGIEGLRLHDNRGEATSKWLLKLGSRDKVRKLVTGHDSEKAFDVYDRRSTEDIMRADEAVQKFLKPVEQPARTV